MSKWFPRRPALVPATALAVTTMACATAVPTDTPGVSQLGDSIRIYEGPRVEAAIATRFASNHLGDEYLVLDAAFIGPRTGPVVAIERDRISVTTPDRRKLPLMTQSEFLDAYNQLHVIAKQIGRLSSPLADFGFPRRACNDWFFIPPGAGLARDVLFVSTSQSCSGQLVFHVPGGVQPGSWELEIELGEGRIEIPFPLPSR